MNYSLSTHVVAIKFPSELINDLALDYDSITFGGAQSYIGSINVHRNESLYTTKGDATGGYVHEKNLNKTGTITLSINQAYDKLVILRRLFNIFEKNDYKEGLTITVSNSDKIVATGIDCVIAERPDETFEESARMQDWVFNSGIINYEE